MKRTRSPADADAVLAALYVLEDRVRALPPDRLRSAIELIVSRVRRLGVRERRKADMTASSQVDLEEVLAAAAAKEPKP